MDRLSIGAVLGSVSGYLYEQGLTHSALVSLLWCVTLVYFHYKEVKGD